MKIQLVIDLADEDIVRIEKFLGRTASAAEVRRFLDEEIAQIIRELRTQYP